MKCADFPRAGGGFDFFFQTAPMLASAAQLSVADDRELDGLADQFMDSPTGVIVPDQLSPFLSSLSAALSCPLTRPPRASALPLFLRRVKQLAVRRLKDSSETSASSLPKSGRHQLIDGTMVLF